MIDVRVKLMKLTVKVNQWLQVGSRNKAVS